MGRDSRQLFSGRVPAELAASADGDVIKVADRVGTHGRLDRRNGLPARLDAVEKVPLMMVAHGQPHVIPAEALLEQ